MDIKILDSWLRDYLKTKATPEKIGEYLSLCGPSVERIEKSGKDEVYDIEITTNRIDTVSVYGIAREASAILPRFGVPAKLNKIEISSKKHTFVKKVKYLNAVVNENLCPRFTAVLIKNVKIDHSPNWMIERLEKSGVRAINNIVDISNYIMLGLGQPVHTFDYDKIKGSKMILRESKKGETLTTLDGKVFDLKGGDIVIEDGEGRLIDLAGVMGGALSMVDENTKNVLLFVQTYNPVAIRKTSMGLAQRTLAATIFEKGTDTELVTPALLLGIELFEKLCKGAAEKEILNIYPKPPKSSKIPVKYDEIIRKLGITISKSEISKILAPLEFETSWKGNVLEVYTPSFRSQDITLAEDVVEEIARIYGYYNLPSEIMTGPLPIDATDNKFAFEDKIKNKLSGFGGCEIYTLSLVPKSYVGAGALKLKNPLGAETEYLRTSLMPSLVTAAKDNLGTKEKFHLFEMANVYIPRPKILPDEKLMLAGIFAGTDYRIAKGVVEALMKSLNIKVSFVSFDANGFLPSHAARISDATKNLGIIGVTEDNLVYYEFEVAKLMESVRPLKFEEISKYPSQVEDLTVNFPDKTKIGEVITSILSVSNIIDSFELKDIYNNSYTFRVSYHSDTKTLTDKDVEKVRKEILSTLKSKFGGIVK